MRIYIYTSHERHLLSAYHSGTPTRTNPQLATLLTRTTRHTPTLLPDIRLYTQTLRRIKHTRGYTFITLNPIQVLHTPGLFKALQEANNPHHTPLSRIKYAKVALALAEKNLKDTTTEKT